MDYSGGSYFSSWPNSSSENYNFVDGSVESYTGGSIPPSGNQMSTTSDHNLKFSEHEKNPTMLTNGCLAYNTQTDLLSDEILSGDKLTHSFLGLQQLQSDGNLQSNLIPPGILQSNSTPGTFHLQLDTPGLPELPHTLSSSIDSSGSEISGFLADVHAVSSASTFCSTFQNTPSFMKPVNLEPYGFQGTQDTDVLRKINHPNGSLSVFDNAALASLHDSKEFVNGSISSIAALHHAQLANSGLRPQKQEQTAMHNIPLPTFISSNQTAVAEEQGAVIPPKIPPLIHDNKSECAISHSSDPQSQANSVHGNIASMKPRVRARRGQATDPHSIAERLRREKISERMKNLQDLVPNSVKPDKASMLDEIIDYVKFLQLQVKVLSMSRLGATGAVLPLLTDSQTEDHSSPPLSAPTISQGLMDTPDSEDSFAFEQEVVKLMETSITSAMQYLQNKGLCLMPIALASAISNQKGMTAAAIPPKR